MLTPEEVIALHAMRAHNLKMSLLELVDAVAPLMDPEYCQPFPSAWELDPLAPMGKDGDVIHEAVKAAWEQARSVLNG